MTGEDMEERDAEKVRCGLYLTMEPIAGTIEAGKLVFFHNHGEPGPAVHRTISYRHNKAIFSRRGIELPFDGYERTLKPLLAEGFYRVLREFSCCEKRCRMFREGTLIQLGYKEDGKPILFVPEWTYKGLVLPSKGTRVSEGDLSALESVKVVRAFRRQDLEPTEPNEVTIAGSGYLH